MYYRCRIQRERDERLQARDDGIIEERIEKALSMHALVDRCAYMRASDQSAMRHGCARAYAYIHTQDECARTCISKERKGERLEEVGGGSLDMARRDVDERGHMKGPRAPACGYRRVGNHVRSANAGTRDKDVCLCMLDATQCLAVVCTLKIEQ